MDRLVIHIAMEVPDQADQLARELADAVLGLPVVECAEHFAELEVKVVLTDPDRSDGQGDPLPIGVTRVYHFHQEG